MSFCTLCGLLRFSRQITGLHRTQHFKRLTTHTSPYSLAKLYPRSDQNFLEVEKIKNTYSDDPTAKEEFTGYIPIDQISFSYCSTSNGEVGEHRVNKVYNTKVELQFHVDNATWIPNWLKPKIKEAESKNISKDGMLIISSDKTTGRLLNQADVLSKVRSMIWKASYVPPEVIAKPQGEVTGKKKGLQIKKKKGKGRSANFRNAKKSKKTKKLNKSR